MKPMVWKEGMTPEETKDVAYWERNMLALKLATYMNEVVREALGMATVDPSYYPCGWYYDTDNNWEGWKRVVSINNGLMTFHVPDDFELGSLPEIKANWSGHSTEQKWLDAMNYCGIEVKDSHSEE